MATDWDSLRARFAIPGDTIYLDGNSLGPMQLDAPQATARILSEWSGELINGWWDGGWWDLPVAIGEQIAPLIGAAPGQVIAGDTTTVNLFKALTAALELRPGRSTVVASRTGFPTTLYVAASVAERQGGEFRLLDDWEGLRLDDTVGVVLADHIDFRTGRIADLDGITASAHEAGALIVWDVSHSAGVLPFSLDEARADFAVGCTYKFLNGGPGAPAYLYCAARHLESSANPIPGWMGHDDPFAMVPDYTPDTSIRRFLTGTQPIVSMRLLSAALAIFEEVSVEDMRIRTTELTERFIGLVDERLEGVTVVSPRDPEHRGAQVTLHHSEAARVFGRLVERGVQGDLRTPDLLRFGFAPLFVTLDDVERAVAILGDVLAEG